MKYAFIELTGVFQAGPDSAEVVVKSVIIQVAHIDSLFSVHEKANLEVMPNTMVATTKGYYAVVETLDEVIKAINTATAIQSLGVIR